MPQLRDQNNLPLENLNKTMKVNFQANQMVKGETKKI
jgi:hypothetical protein